MNISEKIKSKTNFTTGDVAKICEVAPRTVTKWFDSGLLKGYKVPISKDRRIPRKFLIEFMQHHSMPLPSWMQPNWMDDVSVGGES